MLIKTKAKTAIFGALWLAGLMSLTACGEHDQMQSVRLSAEPLVQAIETNPERIATLGSVYGDKTAFDRAVNVCPYTDVADVERDLGFAWDLAAKLALDDESRGSILLVQGQQVSGIIALARADIDLCPADFEFAAQLAPGQRLEFARGVDAAGATGWTVVRG
ncbi:hypothetical protein CQ018_08045 [Arthrobacter sp. MYb227]|uniref:hypothetical protein n=1 Tax=Arthrobacter sp. MYb227 TaxID=1848601 RepID=UPI000CFAC5F4|nr:hypothetical protein [Arthrobacter sp. MYb227]PQZ93608.1 hypothetical protein CQ018_08045 [Arthrobacter sp. MYb227]